MHLMDKNRPPEEVWAERLAFSKEGIPVIEGLANIAQLSGEKNIVFVGFPLAIADLPVMADKLSTTEARL